MDAALIFGTVFATNRIIVFVTLKIITILSGLDWHIFSTKETNQTLKTITIKSIKYDEYRIPAVDVFVERKKHNNAVKKHGSQMK